MNYHSVSIDITMRASVEAENEEEAIAKAKKIARDRFAEFHENDIEVIVLLLAKGNPQVPDRSHIQS